MEALRTRLIPLALVVTPNIPGGASAPGAANRIGGGGQGGREGDPSRAWARAQPSSRAGTWKGPPSTSSYDGRDYIEVAAARVQTTSTHGTGCTFASAIAAHLALGRTPAESVRRAKRYVTHALRAAALIGHGHGPLHHFYRLGRLGG